MPIAALLPRARVVSRTIVVASVLASRGLGSGRFGKRLTLGVLAFGMPHGAADTELLRDLGRAGGRKHIGLLAAYALTAVATTAVVRSGSPWVDRVVLGASAAHFAEGELACWGAPPAGRTMARQALRAVVAATTTALLPAAVGRVQRGELKVGAAGAAAGGLGLLGGERPAWALLRAGTSPGVTVLTAVAAIGTAALALTGDRRAAADTALLTVLDVVAEPSVVFAAYFGGWHSLRHTARVADALVARGELPAQSGLGAAVLTLARRSAWAAGVGVLGAGVLAAAEPERITDNAFTAVVGLTAPHMVTVAAALARSWDGVAP